MPGERKLASWREDAQLGAMRCVFRRLHEHGFGQVELARDRLHRRTIQAIRFEHHRERVPGQARTGEYVERDEAAAHESLLDSLWLEDSTWGDELILRIDEQDLARICLGGAREQTKYGRRSQRQRVRRRAAAQIMPKEQRRDSIARTVDRDR